VGKRWAAAARSRAAKRGGLEAEGWGGQSGEAPVRLGASCLWEREGH
jgi:hypothetical protein